MLFFGSLVFCGVVKTKSEGLILLQKKHETHHRNPEGMT